MYMSYCRFRGALAELRECMQDVEEHINSEGCEIGDEEIHAFHTMVHEFRDWLHDMGILDDDGTIDADMLMEAEEAMACGEAEREEDDYDD